MKLNTNTKPSIPYSGWTVEEHKKLGKIDLSKIFLYFVPEKKERYIKGTELRKKLKDQPVLNAVVLDYLLDNPHLIPDDWKQDAEGNTRYIYFWGTVYRDSGGDLYVRYLYFGGGHWRQGSLWLGYYFGSGGPSAVSASTQFSDTLSSDLEPLTLEKRVA